MYTLTIPGPQGPVIVILDGDYYIVAYGQQTVTTGGSPFFVTADPPIGPVDTLDLGAIYRRVVGLLGL